MFDRGPLPAYIHATIDELRLDRLSLPGVSWTPSARVEVLSANEVDDIHIPLSIAEQVVSRCSSPGESVLDPFAGYGTTLAASERLGRSAVGVELLPEHVRIARARAPQSTVIEGDARGLGALVDGPFDLCFTAPPFLTRNDHPADPLTGYALDGGTYDSYLAWIARIGSQVRELLRPGAYFVLNAANMRCEGVTTALAWDLVAAIDPVISFIAETTIVWDELPHDFTGDYLLTFRR